MIFSNKKILIELYNAIEGTNYSEDTEINIKTLTDVLFMDRMNDISFIIDGKFIILIEHQSTVNYNMPLRLLLYIARIYEKIIDNKSIYRKKLMKIPTPEFVVLYNGKEKQPEEQMLKLSDAFIEKDDFKLELIVKLININYGKSKILEKSKNLNDYSYLMYDIQKYRDAGLSLKGAIKNAVQDCIRQDRLKKFLKEHSAEVENMLYTEFDIDIAKEVWQEEAREDGIQQGIQQGKKEIAKSLIGLLDIETIADKTGLPINEVENLKMKN